MKFMLGCNYWDSVHAMDMWRDYDAEVIRGDMKALAAVGIKYLRVFPNWRDFQPVKRQYGIHMHPVDCVTVDGELPLWDRTGVDPKQIEHFRSFAGICKENGISLVVSVVTGWMSGRMYTPPAVEGKNPVKDPEALMWTDRYIRGFVTAVKDLDNIVMWDLGNECNCMGLCTKEESYVWTAFVRNAIRAADPTRPISSGMHGLSAEEDRDWAIADQGEINDYVTTHPYVSTSLDNDYDPANRLRSTAFPTIQSIFYSDLGGKPVIMQEQNSFTETTANEDMQADFARANILSCISHNIEGHFWWCAHENIDKDYAPFTWTLMERSLGILDLKRQPKRIALELKKMSERIAALPFESLPPYERDAVCVLTQTEKWKNGSVCSLLAKQAGLEVKFVIGDRHDWTVPDSKMYFVPGAGGWSVMHKHTLDVIERAVREDGATVLMSYDGGMLIDVERIFGIRPNGCLKSRTTHTAEFPFGKLGYAVCDELILKEAGAEVLARNETGNIVMSKHKYGKGTAYFLNFPLERNLATCCNAFSDTDWYKIYRLAFEKELEALPIRSDNPQVALTRHKTAENEYIVCAVNYSDKTQNTELHLGKGWTLETIEGSADKLDKCDGAFYRIRKTGK